MHSLFETVADPIFFGLVDREAVLTHAAEVAMAGYLPLDLEYVEKQPCLLIY